MAGPGLGSFVGKLAQGFATTKMSLDQVQREQDDKALQREIDFTQRQMSLTNDPGDLQMLSDRYHELLTNGLGKKGSKGKKAEPSPFASIIDAVKGHFAEAKPGIPDTSLAGVVNTSGAVPGTPAAAPPQAPPQPTPQRFVLPEGGDQTGKLHIQRGRDEMAKAALDREIAVAKAQGDIQRANRLEEIKAQGEESRKTLLMKPATSASFTYDGKPIYAGNGELITEDTNGQPLVAGRAYRQLKIGGSVSGLAPGGQDRVTTGDEAHIATIAKLIKLQNPRLTDEQVDLQARTKFQQAQELINSARARQIFKTDLTIDEAVAANEGRLTPAQALAMAVRSLNGQQKSNKEILDLRDSYLAATNSPIPPRGAPGATTPLDKTQFGRNPPVRRGGGLNLNPDGTLKTPAPAAGAAAKPPSEADIRSAVKAQLVAAGIANPNDAQITAVLNTGDNRAKVVKSLTGGK